MEAGRTHRVDALIPLSDIAMHVLGPEVRESRSYYVTDMQDDPEGHPGCLLVTLKAHFEAEVISWLLSWGSRVEVLEPESLKRRLARIAKEIYEKYSD